MNTSVSNSTTTQDSTQDTPSVSLQKDRKRIESYSLMEYTEKVQQAAMEGYTVGTSNEDYPQSYGTYLSCTMVKDVEAEVEVKRKYNKSK